MKFRQNTDCYSTIKNDKTLTKCRILSFFVVLEATPGFEPGIRVLQTRALPLGYIADFL